MSLTTPPEPGAENPTPPAGPPSPPSAGSPSSPGAADASSSAPRAPRPVTLPVLLGVAAAVVVLVFGASFLGASLARGSDPITSAPVTDAAATDSADSAESPEASDQADDATEETIDEDYLAEVLPAGSAIRAGKGTPDEGSGIDGDVYLDIASANVYLHRDGAWAAVGNLKQSAAEHLTGAAGETGAQGEAGAQGETGAQGESGAQGETGAPGPAGQDGTQIVLGSGSPPATDSCGNDGDIYFDTDDSSVYLCTAGSWVAR